MSISKLAYVDKDDRRRDQRTDRKPQSATITDPPAHRAEGQVCSLNSKLSLGDPINASLKSHALSLDCGEWEYGELSNTLHDWTEIFVREFELGLEIPALQVEPISTRVLGTYRDGRNGLGLKHEITLNARHLRRGLAELLVTLLHELL